MNNIVIAVILILLWYRVTSLIRVTRFRLQMLQALSETPELSRTSVLIGQLLNSCLNGRAVAQSVKWQTQLFVGPSSRAEKLWAWYFICTYPRGLHEALVRHRNSCYPETRELCVMRTEPVGEGCSRNVRSKMTEGIPLKFSTWNFNNMSGYFIGKVHNFLSLWLNRVFWDQLIVYYQQMYLSAFVGNKP
jgi:hypothetical protein